MAQYPVGPRATQVWTGLGAVLLANQDLTNSVTVSDQPNVSIGAPNADIIPPLGSIAYTGRSRLYAIAPAGTLALLAITGGTSWAPSPAQVALQIQALGLAKDTTLQAASSQLTTGVKPYIPNLLSVNAIGQGPGSSPVTMLTFSGAGRIWAIHLSFATSCNASHTGTDQMYAQLKTGSGKTLTIIETAVGGPGGSDSGDSDLVMNGFPMAQADTILLDINNGATVTNAIFRASAVVLYSIP